MLEVSVNLRYDAVSPGAWFCTFQDNERVSYAEFHRILSPGTQFPATQRLIAEEEISQVQHHNNLR